MTSTTSGLSGTFDVPADIGSALDTRATRESLGNVANWLDRLDSNVNFWQKLPQQDVDYLYEWSLSSKLVQLSWLLAGLICLAITLLFSLQPILDKGPSDPLVALMFTPFLLFFTGMCSFGLLFTPLTKGLNFVFRRYAASRITNMLESVMEHELESLYQQAGQSPIAAQYIYDVRQHRKLCRQDLHIAGILIRHNTGYKSMAHS